MLEKKISNNILNLKSHVLSIKTQKWEEMREGIKSVMHPWTYMEDEIVTTSFFTLIDKLINNVF